MSPGVHSTYLYTYKRGVSPDSIKGSDGKLPLPLQGLASDEVLCEMVGQLAGFPHQRLVLQVLTRYLLVDVLQAHEEGPMAEPEPDEDTFFFFRVGSDKSLRSLMLPTKRKPSRRSRPWLPGRVRLGHPHEVHVAGQQGDVRRLPGLVNTAEVSVGQQNVDDELQVGLPSDRLPEQDHGCVCGYEGDQTSARLII